MTPEQLSNCKDLSALGHRILAEPERYPLWLNAYECGTHACWLGWYAKEQGVNLGLLNPFGYAGDQFGDEVIDQKLLHQRKDKYATASDEDYAELARRLPTLDSIIAQHDKPQPNGIPDSIVRIFDEAETA